jgi:hypothetical protein
MGIALLLQDARPRLKFAFIHRYRTEYKIGIMCRVLQVSRGGYTRWILHVGQASGGAALQERDGQSAADSGLTAAIQTTFKKSKE